MIEKVNIKDIKSNDNNPRFIRDTKFNKLKESITQFPEMLKLRPIIVNKDGVILGGNMRYKASLDIGLKEVYILRAEQLTPEQEQEFIVKDNVGFGEWDWDILANEWDINNLDDWGLDLPVMYDLNVNELGEDFVLPDGDKTPFQRQAYILADAQAEQIKNAIADVKKTEEYNYVETFGNKNTNGNALYLIISQWVEQRK